MAELITQRIPRNAAELRLHAIAAKPDEVIDRAEHAQVGYRAFLDVILESELAEIESRLAGPRRDRGNRVRLCGCPHRARI